MQELTPTQYLYADIAGRFGKDDLSWTDRMLFTSVNLDRLEEMIPEAKEPILFAQAVRALRDVQAGKPTGYPVMFDASASGLQILSILTGDTNGAAISNVTGSTRTDPYGAIYGHMMVHAGCTGTLTREVTKKAIMTSLYGSEKELENLFGVDVEAFYKTMEECVPQCWELNRFILQFLKTSTALSYDWVLPDNFHVSCPVTATEYTDVMCLGMVRKVGKKVNKAHNRNRSLCANLTHSVEAFTLREVVRRCNTPEETRQHVEDLLLGKGSTYSHAKDTAIAMRLWNLYQESGYLSVRILKHINKASLAQIEPMKIAEMLDSLPANTFAIKSVHDCVAVHPNYAHDLLEQYREVYAQVAESKLLEFTLKQILQMDISLDITPIKGIRESCYSFS